MLALPRQQRGGDGQVALHKAACPEAVNQGLQLSVSSLENPQFTMLVFILPESKPDQRESPVPQGVC